MARFSYRGVDESGRDTQGVLDAPSLKGAAADLRQRGISAHVLERTDRQEASRPPDEMDAFSYFNRSLSELSRVGIPLPTAIREISQGLRRGRFREDLARVESALKEGRSLAEAVAEAGGSFPPYYRSMVSAGISSGDLPSVLLAVARSHDGLRRARRAVINSLAYPVSSLCFGLVLIGLSLVFFLPRWIDFYRLRELDTSPLVGLLFDVYQSPALPAVLLVGSLVFLGGLACWLLRTAAGESILFSLPMAGGILRSLAMARFLSVSAILLQNRAPLPDAIRVAAGASGSRILNRDAERMSARAAEGERLVDILRGSKVVSGDISAYLLLAEEGGALPEAASEIAELQMERAAAHSDTLYFILFPLGILVNGLVVGSMVLTFVSSYFDLLKQLPR